MRVLIIGLGSIAQKHINALKQLVSTVEFDALRSNKGFSHIEGVNSITEIDSHVKYNFILISNPTAYHHHTLLKVIPYKIPIFLEKPPLQNLDNLELLNSEILKNNSAIYVAYNLRFLDSIIEIKKILSDQKINEVNIYCGSYLPNWRPYIDYKTSYSAHKEMGGGVNLDLIHELDYTCFLFGNPMKVKSFFNNQSTLEIEAVDYAHYVLNYENFIANITLNYFRKDAKRQIEIVCENRTLTVDLLKNCIFDHCKNEIIFTSNQTVIDTYKDQMRYFIKEIEKNTIEFDPFERSLNTLKYAIT